MLTEGGSLDHEVQLGFCGQSHRTNSRTLGGGAHPKTVGGQGFSGVSQADWSDSSLRKSARASQRASTARRIPRYDRSARRSRLRCSVLAEQKPGPTCGAEIVPSASHRDGAFALAASTSGRASAVPTKSSKREKLYPCRRMPHASVLRVRNLTLPGSFRDVETCRAARKDVKSARGDFLPKKRHRWMTAKPCRPLTAGFPSRR